MALKRPSGSQQFSLESLPLDVQQALVFSDDRSAALVGATLVDKCLEDYFRSLMVDRSKEVSALLDVRNASAVLGSFHAKIEVAFCIGAISQSERADLHVVRDVRNDFAHNVIGCTFDDPIVQAHCKKLSLCWKALKGQDVSLRKAFNMEIYLLLGILNFRRRQAAHAELPSEFIVGGE